VSTKAVMGTTATGRRRKRSWPDVLKREIVAASLAPGASVSVVARQYDVNANQVFSWRKRYRDSADGSAEVTRLLPVTIAAEDDGVVGQAAIAGEQIEIDVAGRYRVRIGGSFDGRVLRRVLDVLERR
jgi:transposase